MKNIQLAMKVMFIITGWYDRADDDGEIDSTEILTLLQQLANVIADATGKRLSIHVSSNDEK